jgi:hypothetical protein
MLLSRARRSSLASVSGSATDTLAVTRREARGRLGTVLVLHALGVNPTLRDWRGRQPLRRDLELDSPVEALTLVLDVGGHRLAPVRLGFRSAPPIAGLP